jgi:hypothetical protein
MAFSAGMGYDEKKCLKLEKTKITLLPQTHADGS